MNTAEKLRFLADRAEDGKEFMIRNGVFKFEGDKLYDIDSKRTSLQIFNSVVECNLKLKPQWEFTEDEKAILRNVSTTYNWIARNEDGNFTLTLNKPKRNQTYWSGMYLSIMQQFSHIFKSIQWEDEEPCEFRRYL